MVSHQLASHVVDQAEAMGYLKKTLQRGLHIVFPNPNCRLDNPPHPPPPNQRCFSKFAHLCLLLAVRKLGCSSFITRHHNWSSPFFSLLCPCHCLCILIIISQCICHSFIRLSLAACIAALAFSSLGSSGRRGAAKCTIAVAHWRQN